MNTFQCPACGAVLAATLLVVTNTQLNAGLDANNALRYHTDDD
jgi:hypothetical protein